MIRPLGDRLLVSVVEKKELKLESGIVLPGGWDVAPETLQAEVVAVGPDVDQSAERGIHVGVIVLVAQFAPTAAKERPGDKTFIVPADDVLGIVTPDKA